MPSKALTAAACALAAVGFVRPPAAQVSVPQSLVFNLPPPTGPAPIGTTRWIAADPMRRDTFAATSAPRQVPVVAWYPADPPASRAPAPYLREGLIEVRSLARLVRLAPGAFDDFSLVRTHATLDVSPAAGVRLPLLVFSHGYTGMASAHTALLEDLASQGFAVLSINHPYESTGATLQSGRVVSVLDDAGTVRPEIRGVLDEWKGEDAAMTGVTGAARSDAQRRLLKEYLATLRQTNVALDRWVADTRLVLDQLSALAANTPAGRLAGQLDLGRIGAFGHSMGGVTAGQFCVEDRRCRAALNLDGIPQYGSMIERAFGRPFMMIYSARPGRTGASDAIYRQAASQYYRADVRDTLHLDFTDMAFWQPLRDRGALGKLDPVRATDATRRLVREFFDQALRGRPSPLLSGREKMADVSVTVFREGRPKP